MEQQIKKLVGHTDQLLECFLGVKQKYAFLHPMIADPQVAQRHGSRTKAEGFATIRQALFLDSIQDVVKLSCDSDERTPSVTNIMNEVAKDDVRQFLREALRAAIRSWDADVREQKSTVFDETYSVVSHK